MEYRKKTKYLGVYERISEKKIFNGKPDVCFDIAYRLNGKLTWEKVGWISEGYSPKLANEIRAERMRSMRHGEELPKQKNKSPFFRDIAAKYLAWAKENKKSWYSDQHRYKNHLAERLDDKRLEEISSFDLERMKSDLTKEELAAQTVKHCLVLIRQMFNKAIAWGLYKGMNPIKGVKMPTIQNQRERFLSYEEADLLLNELLKVSKQTHDIALLSLHCGLRAGEIFNLKGHDIDFRNDLIHISDPKNKQGRKAFVTSAVKEMLKERIPESPDDYIFKAQNNGDKINEISRTYRKIANHLFNKKVNDPRQKVTFHTLRHSFASWLALQGESLITIRELLGHKSFAMTQRYAHLIKTDEKRRATLNLEKVFTEKRNGNNIAAISSEITR
jgi:integrase